MRTVWILSLCGTLLIWLGSGSALEAAFLFSGSSQVSLSLVDISDANGQPLNDLPTDFSASHSVSWYIQWHTDSMYDANYLIAGPAASGATVPFPLGESFTGTSSIAASLNTRGGTSITPAFAVYLLAGAMVFSEERLTISNSTANDYSVTLEIDSSYSLEGAAISQPWFRKNYMSLVWFLSNSETGEMQNIHLWSDLREGIAAADSLHTQLQIFVSANATREFSLSAELFGHVVAYAPEPSTLALVLTAAGGMVLAFLQRRQSHRPSSHHQIRLTRSAETRSR